MSLTTSEMSPADFGALMGNNNDGAFGGNGAWWLIVLFLFIFAGGWGNGFGGRSTGSGAMDNYVLNSDFAELSRQLDNSTDRLAMQGNQIANGLCDGFYTQAQLVNGVNTNILQSANALQNQISSCCCDNREAIAGINYNMAMNSNATQNAITSGFCQTNFNNQTNTRDIIESQNAGTRAILDAIQANKVEALNQRIAEQTQQINALQLSASQSAQNQYLISQLKASPIPAYTVPNPYCCNSYGCGCNS